jgi:circadian clock protein KaiC
VYVGPEGVLTGSMRLAQEARERASAADRHQKIEHKRRELRRKRHALEAEITSMREELVAGEEELGSLLDENRESSERTERDEAAMRRSRRADATEMAGSRVRSRNDKPRASESSKT